MEPRYHPREQGKRLESIEYKKTQKKKKVFPMPSTPYNEKSRSRSNSRSRKGYRKKENFPAPSPPHNEPTPSRSKSRKKREKLHKMRNAHGENEIHRYNFWK
uniref:Uncharacterized protein n=1 Tax=viral metagenome TaxID=1070528 RepID=A0A6C0HIE6_9ZZZZ